MAAEGAARDRRAIVRLPSLPVDWFWQVQDWSDSLTRELSLLVIDDPDGTAPSGGTARSILQIVQDARRDFVHERRELHDQLRAAWERGDPTTDAEVGLPVDAGERFAELLAAFERADELSREGVLLMPPTPAHVARARRQLLGGIAEQLRAAYGEREGSQ